VAGARDVTDAVLALNAGSSSVKFALFDVEGGRPVRLLKGVLEDRGAAPRLTAQDEQGATLVDRHWPEGATHEETFGAALDWIETHLGAERLIGAGHRIVHGGREFVAPLRLDDQAIAALEALTPLAPLHQPRSLEPIRALRAVRPDLPQIGCFDTAFHATLAPPVTLYALPFRFADEGLRKYGFHGLSYEHIAGRLAEEGLSAKRTVVAHLGGGASLCAMREGRSVDTSMGFSTLDGLVMGTRTGSVDPGIVFYLARVHKLPFEEIERMFYLESGLLGVSGISADVRTLLASDDPRAKAALDLFAFRAAREVAMMATSLGGLELLVFTGGIGEHAAPVRAAISARLAWLGADLDVRVMAANEERVIAVHTLQALSRRV
jgi:acetate kinase